MTPRSKKYFFTFTFTRLEFKIEFPSVTICGPGSSDKTLVAGFYKLYLDFLAGNNVTIGVTPYSTAQLLQVSISPTFYEQLFH